jgi:hypothetical protein
MTSTICGRNVNTEPQSVSNINTDFDSDSDPDPDEDEDDIRRVRQLLEDVEILPLNAEVQLPPTESEIPNGPNDPPPEVEHQPMPPNDPEPQLGGHVFIEKFTEGRPGAPIENRDVSAHIRYQDELGGQDNPFAPFKSKTDWEFARWAKTRGIGETAVTDLLSIEGVGIDFFDLLIRSLMEVRFRFKSGCSSRIKILVNSTKLSTPSYRLAHISFVRK